VGGIKSFSSINPDISFLFLEINQVSPSFFLSWGEREGEMAKKETRSLKGGTFYSLDSILSVSKVIAMRSVGVWDQFSSDEKR